MSEVRKACDGYPTVQIDDMEECIECGRRGVERHACAND